MHKFLIGFCSTATLSRSLPQCLACLARSYFRHRRYDAGKVFVDVYRYFFWQGRALRGLALGRRRRDRPLPHSARALHLQLWHLRAVYLRDRGTKAVKAKSQECTRSANSRISRAKLSSSLRLPDFGLFCVKISPRRLRSLILRSRFGALCAMASTSRPFASLYCRLAFKISLQILPPRHT